MSEDQPRVKQRRIVTRRRFIGGVATAGALTLSGCTPCPWWPAHGEFPVGGHSSVPEVTSRGFDVTFGPTRISAPAGVAPAGTPIVITPSAPMDLGEAAEFVIATVEPIEITLGDRLQPDQPVSIAFTIDPAQLPAPVSDAFPLVVISTPADAQVADYLDGTWDPSSSTFTAVTEHLSPFGLFQLDIGKLISDFIDRLLGLTFPTPSCAFLPATVDGTTYSIVDPEDDSAWPCISESQGKIVVDVHSNSVLPWAVKSAPLVSGTVSGGFKDIGPGLATYYQELYGAMGDQRLALMPGNSVSLSFNPSAPPEIVQLKLDVGLYLATTLLYAAQSSLTIFFGRGGRVAETVLEGFDSLDCILDIMNTSYEIEDDRNLTGVVKSALSCILALMEENLPKLSWKFIGNAILTVMNLLVGGASLIAGGLIGAYKTATSSDTIVFRIESTSNASTPTASGTPAATPIPASVGRFGRGEMVETTEPAIFVYSGPGLSYEQIWTSIITHEGEIIGGPVQADGYTWWHIRTRLLGNVWVQEGYLEPLT